MRRRTDAPGDLAEMLMMGQVDDLAALCHVREQPEGFFGTEIVEGLHDVIGHEGHGATRLGEFVLSGDAQREIELEARAFRELVRGLRTAGGGDGDQRLAILAGLRRKAGIGSPADRSERGGGPLHHGAAMTVPIDRQSLLRGGDAGA